MVCSAALDKQVSNWYETVAVINLGVPVCVCTYTLQVFEISRLIYEFPSFLTWGLIKTFFVCSYTHFAELSIIMFFNHEETEKFPQISSEFEVN